MITRVKHNEVSTSRLFREQCDRPDAFILVVGHRARREKPTHPSIKGDATDSRPRTSLSTPAWVVVRSRNTADMYSGRKYPCLWSEVWVCGVTDGLDAAIICTVARMLMKFFEDRR